MDNTSAMDLSYDPVLHSKTKHIARRDLFIRELVERQVVATKYIATSQIIADALTKPLTPSSATARRLWAANHCSPSCHQAPQS